MVERRTFLKGSAVAAGAALLEGCGEDVQYLVQPLGTSGSHLLASLAEANCLIMVEEDVTEVSVGEEVLVSFLAQRG